MSHSLWWMQEELVERQYGTQLKDAKARLADCKQRNEDNQFEVYTANAKLMYVEKIGALATQIKSLSRQICVLEGKEMWRVMLANGINVRKAAGLNAPKSGILLKVSPQHAVQC